MNNRLLMLSCLALVLFFFGLSGLKAQPEHPEKGPIEEIDDILDYHLLQKIFDRNSLLPGDPIHRKYNLSPGTRIQYEFDPMEFKHTWKFSLDIEVSRLFEHMGGIVKTTTTTFKCELVKKGFHQWIKIEKIPDGPDVDPVIIFSFLS